MIWWSADAHFGHENIIKFCNRPFKNLHHMHKILIQNWNERVKSDDIIYHVGDFAFHGGWQGQKESYKKYQDKLNGTIVHILGNHDRNNGIKKAIEYAEIKIGSKIWAMQHKPPLEDNLRQPQYLVGHVHEKWKHIFIGNSLIVNVGVDVWDYRPVDINKIMKYLAHNLTEEEKDVWETNNK